MNWAHTPSPDLNGKKKSAEIQATKMLQDVLAEEKTAEARRWKVGGQGVQILREGAEIITQIIEEHLKGCMQVRRMQEPERIQI